MQPLVGITVLDLSRHLPGPWLTRILADLGATVIKVESPKGDPVRNVSPLGPDGLGTFFATLNAGKQCVALDMRSEEGRAVLLELASKVDVLVESFRTGTLAAMGLDDDTLQRLNPRLVLCSLTGFGQTGPDATRPGHDINFLARAGVLSQAGPADATPPAPFVQVADVAGGSYPGAIGILAALAERERTGVGRRLDISLTRSVAGMGVFSLSRATGGQTEPRGGGMLTGGLASYRCYRAGDGRFLALGALEPQFFHQFCTLLEVPHLFKSVMMGRDRDGKAAAEIEAVLATRSAEEWVAFFDGHDVCLELVLTPEEALADLGEPVVTQLGDHRVVGLHVGAPTPPRQPARALGADNVAACTALGVDAHVLAKAVEAGVFSES